MVHTFIAFISFSCSIRKLQSVKCLTFYLIAKHFYPCKWSWCKETKLGLPWFLRKQEKFKHSTQISLYPSLLMEITTNLSECIVTSSLFRLRWELITLRLCLFAITWWIDNMMIYHSMINRSLKYSRNYNMSTSVRKSSWNKSCTNYPRK